MGINSTKSKKKKKISKNATVCFQNNNKIKSAI